MPLPPRPKETQRHLALTQLQKSWENLCLLVRASAPKIRRGRAGALTSRKDRRKQGRALRFPSPLLVLHTGRGDNDHHRHLSLCLCNSLPRRLWPHPLLQHEVIANQSLGARQSTSGTDWLRGPPLPLPTPLTRRSGSLGSEKTESAISGRDPRKQEPESPCHFSLGKPFILWPPLFLRDNRLSVPPLFNHRHIKEFPLPSPHTVPPAGKSFPGAKEVGGNNGNCTDGNGSFLPRYTVAGRRR